jgi:protein O-GlcNAc transferase
VLAAAPEHIEALNNRALCLLKLERHEEALAGFDRLLRIKPDNVLALSNRGSVLRKLGRADEALACYEKALSINPAHLDALNNRASVLIERNRSADALLSLEKGLALKPADAGLLSNRGIALHQLGRYAEALQSLDQALATEPNRVIALLIRGHIFARLGRLDDAILSYERILAIEPDHGAAIGSLASCKLKACDWKTVAKLAALLQRNLRDGKPVSGPIFSIFTKPADQLRWAKANSSKEFNGLARASARRLAAPSDKIRIAYLSPDFHEHATAYLVAELFELHDRARFEIIGIGYGPDDRSAMRERILKSFNKFHDVRLKGDGEIAKLIIDQDVHIAVDLKGPTDYGRPAILASRPSPVQVNFLGYPGTMGADFIDYIIADRIVLPFDQQPFYTENIVHLPNSYQPNDRKRRIAAHVPSRSELQLPQTGFVFCSFNVTYKIRPPLFDIWMNLLRKVENSVLWLFQSDESAVANLRVEAAAHGIDPARLVFAPRCRNEDHLARHRSADLFLDTLPVCAHTTASDALWAGLPVLSCLGSAFVGRVAASLLHAIGVPELIVNNLEEYEALALKLATEPQLLQSIRDKLARNRSTFPLFDADRFRRDIEAAYARMWEIHQRGERPRSFAVDAS